MAASKVGIEELLESWLEAQLRHTALQKVSGEAVAATTEANNKLTQVGNAISSIAEPTHVIYNVRGTGIMVIRGSYPKVVPLKFVS